MASICDAFVMTSQRKLATWLTIAGDAAVAAAGRFRTADDGHGIAAAFESARAAAKGYLLRRYKIVKSTQRGAGWIGRGHATHS